MKLKIILNRLPCATRRPPREAVALGSALLLLLFTHCQPSRDGEAVDYGPQSSEADLNSALTAPLADLNIASLDVGQFVHFSSTDGLAGGELVQLVSDTGQTIVDRQDSDDAIRYSVVQNKFTYGASAPQKASVEYQLNVGKETPSPTPDPGTSPAPTTGPTPTPTPTSSATPAPSTASSSSMSANAPSTLAVVPSLIARLHHLQSAPHAQNDGPSLARQIRDFTFAKLKTSGHRLTGIPFRSGPLSEASASVTATDTNAKMTVHRLKTWEDLEAPPDLVKNQPGCLGLANCQIRVRHIMFDQVTWDKPSGTRVQFDLAMSPDVPLLSGYKMSPIFDYYPGLIKSCITLMIPVGTEGNETLLTECNQTENFAYVPQPE